MKLFNRFFLLALMGSFLLASCEKEYSNEKGGSVIVDGGTAEGTLTGSPSTCANITVKGAYGAGLAMNDSNKVILEMDFSQIGTYYVTTDTINGVYFSKSGTINATGPTSITLDANGTPSAIGSFSYKVTFKTSSCTFDLDVYQVAPSNGSDYFPTTVNSYWKFVSSDPAAAPEDTLRTTSDNAVFTIGTNTYNLFISTSSAGEDSLYYRKGSGEYHQFGDMDIAGAASNVVAADYIFLKDNVAVGSSWQSPEGDAVVNSTPVKMRLSFTVSGKGENVQLGNAVFKDVIKIITSEQVQLPAGWTTVLTFETWYAKGIGIINIAAPVPFYGYQVESYQVF